jgi:CYTH domain-containing protein
VQKVNGGKAMNTPLEIERKYVIEMPEVSELSGCERYTVSEIEQTYLESALHVTHRVRSRRYCDATVYTETKKVRIDKMSVYEDEREISKREYLDLLEKRKEDTVTLRKTRHTFDYLGQIFEIDVYPEWRKSAILETELESRETVVEFPDFIRIIKEVTGEKKYSNAAMSREFPEELI